MNNGQFWNLSLQVRLPPCGEGLLFMMTALYRTASCGYCALVPPGLTCRRNSRLHQPAVADSASGAKRAYSETSPRHSPVTLKSVGPQTSRNASLTARSWWQKGGAKAGKTRRGKGTRLMAIADASGLPLALHTDSASPHEVTPVRAALDEIVTVGQPGRIVGDRAHDSDPPDNAPAAQGIGMMAPHRRNRKRKATQDGRPLRRYRRRRKIERLLAWLNTFRRTMARRDRFHQHVTALVHLAFSMILLGRVIRES